MSVTLPIVSKIRNDSEFRAAKCIAKAYAEALEAIEGELNLLWGKISEYGDRKEKNK